jgi:hypothetical protein
MQRIYAEEGAAKLFSGIQVRRPIRAQAHATHLDMAVPHTDFDPQTLYPAASYIVH